ncbi:MAG TPA: amidase [Nocardioidaceae bacterium]|nr:amidase [Nocardioidaceae bacterium]
MIEPCLHGRVPSTADAAALGAYVDPRAEGTSESTVAVKDNVDVRGLPTRAGSAATPGTPASADAPVITRMRQHGFVPGRKTAMDEFAFTTYGPEMRNPYDETRIVGGSSGGSALAVATGETCWAIGTDTGGSVRIPAAFCGVVGFKPTSGRIPTQGVIPLSWSLDHVGILGCSVAAVADLAAATMNPMPGPSTALTDGDQSIRGLRVGRPDDDHLAAARPDVRDAFEDALASVRAAGASVVPVTLPPIGAYAETHMYILLAEAAYHHTTAYGDLSDHDADVRRYVEVGAGVSASDYLHASRRRSTMTEQVDVALAEVDLLALPTTPLVAPARDERLVELGDGETVDVLTACIWYTHLFNHTGMPAISLPIDQGALPVGIQLAAARGADEFLLRSAQLIQRHMGVEAS